MSRRLCIAFAKIKFCICHCSPHDMPRSCAKKLWQCTSAHDCVQSFRCCRCTLTADLKLHLQENAGGSSREAPEVPGVIDGKPFPEPSMGLPQHEEEALVRVHLHTAAVPSALHRQCLGASVDAAVDEALSIGSHASLPGSRRPRAHAVHPNLDTTLLQAAYEYMVDMTARTVAPAVGSNFSLTSSRVCCSFCPTTLHVSTHRASVICWVRLPHSYQQHDARSIVLDCESTRCSVLHHQDYSFPTTSSCLALGCSGAVHVQPHPPPAVLMQIVARDFECEALRRLGSGARQRHEKWRWMRAVVSPAVRILKGLEDVDALGVLGQGINGEVH